MAEVYSTIDGCRLVRYQCAIARRDWDVIKGRFYEAFLLQKKAYRHAYGGSTAPCISEDVEARWRIEKREQHQVVVRHTSLDLQSCVVHNVHIISHPFIISYYTFLISYHIFTILYTNYIQQLLSERPVELSGCPPCFTAQVFGSGRVHTAKPQAQDNRSPGSCADVSVSSNWQRVQPELVSVASDPVGHVQACREIPKVGMNRWPAVQHRAPQRSHD